MQQLENRSFETRFGSRCPFCNRTWGDPSPCGDSRADRTIRDGLRLLFADKVDNCSVCNKQVQQGRKYCFDCSLSVERQRNKTSRHRMVEATCHQCGTTYEHRSDHKGSKFCSLSCSNKARAS